MLSLKERGILELIIEHCGKIIEKIEKTKKDEFSKNEDLQQIVCFNLLQIGELIKYFNDDFLNKHKEIPWIKIKAMRNKIVHGYGLINQETVWLTSINDIPQLLNYCKKVIES